MLRHQLKTFLTVCETGSFSKAAAALYITPSAVLQQIQTLEADFKVPLFYRTSKGVSLTQAGEFLELRGRALSHMSEELRRDMQSFVSNAKPICVGTSIMEKIRLLYELWVLFSEEEKDCEIQMVNIDAAHNIPANTDLIESINSGIDWMREWEFFEICRVPFGFAVANNHPLAQKKLIRQNDLAGQTVMTINEGSCDVVAELLDLLRRSHAQVVFPGRHSTNPLWESAFRRDALLVPMCWNDILINMTVIPFEFDYSLPYGIFYRSQPHASVQRFLDFIKLTYGEGNSHGIVPVLT